MSRVVKIVCLLIAVVSFPIVLMIAGFAPALMGGSSAMTTVQKIGGTSLMLVFLAVPFWVLYFGWRTIRTWGNDSLGPALLMALPATLAILFFVYVNFARTAP